MTGRRAIELSHTITDGIETYRGLPGPRITDFLTRAASRDHFDPGTEFQIGHIMMVANTGTYLDVPFHRFPDGADLAQVGLDKLADLDAVVVRVPGVRAIDADRFDELDVGGCAVLVHTGWDAHWTTDAYFDGHPFLTAAAGTLLRDRGAALVGIDSLNIDDTDDGSRPVHTALLGAGIPIVEHLTNLDALPDRGARFTAVPVKIAGMGSFPVRAFALA